VKVNQVGEKISGVCMYVNGKMRPVETVSGMVSEGDEGEWWRG
jgi:hypothetical protein